MKTENANIIDDRALDAIFMAIDPNQPPNKVLSKLKVVLLISNWKTSNALSCVEVCYFTTGKSNITEKEQSHTSSLTDRVKM